MTTTPEPHEGRRVEWIFFAISFVLGLIVGDTLNHYPGLVVDVALLGGICLAFWMWMRATKRSRTAGDATLPRAFDVALWPLIFLFSFSVEQLGAAAANALGPLGVLLIVLLIVIGARVTGSRAKTGQRVEADGVSETADARHHPESA